MTREEMFENIRMGETHNGFAPKWLVEIIREHYDDIEDISNSPSVAYEDGYQVATKENLKEIEKLKKDRDYWKNSFNKQVEANRGGYQPVKQNDGEPLPPPKEE